MIKIDKSGQRPSILIANGVDEGKDKLEVETQKLLDFYTTYQAKIDIGEKKFTFKKNLYAAPAIKEALINIQGNKCCFCEAKVTTTGDGDVEHFRPKAAWKQVSNDAYAYPGYFWLAYDWDNLFLACLKCNQRNKKNLFPLIDTTTRADGMTRNIELETPFFIHPEQDNPEAHITFDGAFIQPKNHSERGRRTILALNLERMQLIEDRLEFYTNVKTILDLYLLIPDIIPGSHISKAEARETLRKAIASTTSFSGMIKANFGNQIQQILSEEEEEA